MACVSCDVADGTESAPVQEEASAAIGATAKADTATMDETTS